MDLNKGSRFLAYSKARNLFLLARVAQQENDGDKARELYFESLSQFTDFKPFYYLLLNAAKAAFPEALSSSIETLERLRKTAPHYPEAGRFLREIQSRSRQ